MILVVAAAAWKQISYNFLFFVAGLQAIPKIADRGCRHRRRAGRQALLDDRLPAAGADHLLPARRQHRLRAVRHVRHHPRRDRRRTRQGDRDAGLQGLQRRLREPDLGISAAQSVILMVIVIALTAFQFRYVEKQGALWVRPDHDRDAAAPSRPVRSAVIAHVAADRSASSIVAFPIYYTFVASTHSLQTILRPPLPLLPATEFVDELLRGAVRRRRPHRRRRCRPLLFNTTVVALGIAIGKIIISILSAYAIVFFRFPFRMVFFWLIFITLMLPVEVRILPTYKVMVDLGSDRHLCRPDPAADRLGDRDAAVPAVLPDDPGRTGRGRPRRWRRAVPLLQGHPAAAVAHQHRGALRHPLHLRLDAVSVAAAGHQPQRHEHHRHRAEEDDLLCRCRHRMAPRHGDLRAGHPAADPGRRPDAALVRAGLVETEK